MPPFRYLAGLILLLVLSGCAGVNQTMTPPPEIVATAGAATDEVVVSYSHNAMTEPEWEAMFDVRSESGIGSGRVELKAGDWPYPITLRLHLGGLEELSIVAGDATVQLSASSGPGQVVRQSLSLNGAAGEELTSESPYWLGLEAGAGYYDVRLPPALMAAGVESFDLHWVDFYR